MSRMLSPITLALAAAAVAAIVVPAAGAAAGTGSHSYVGHPGGPGAAGPVLAERNASQSYIGHPGGPGAAGPILTPAKVDPLAVGHLTGLGLSPSEVKAWTVGICSHASKPSVCYAPFERLAAAASAPTEAVRPGGFDWGDAGIGAGTAIGLALLLAGMGSSLLIARQNRRREAEV